MLGEGCLTFPTTGLITIILTGMLKPFCTRSLKLFFFYLLVAPALYVNAGLEFSEEEKKFIKDHPTVIVGGETDWPPYDFVEDGEYTGAAKDFLKLLEERTGLKLQVTTGYTWNELLEMIRQKEIDVLPMLWFTEERTSFINYTRPYLNIRHYLYVSSEDDSIESLDDLADKTLAIPKGYAHIEFIRENHPLIKILEVSGSLESIDSVITGKADALIENTALVAHYRRTQNIKGIEPVAAVDVGVSELHLGVRKDWPVLRDILQKGFDDISDEEIDIITSRWLGYSATRDVSEPGFNLSLDEKNYLKRKQQLSMCYFPDMAPFSFTEQNRLAGMAKDYVNLLENSLGVKIKPIHSKNHHGAIHAISKGECDFHLAISKHPKIADSTRITNTYFQDNIVLATHDDVSFIADMAKLKNKKIGVLKHSVFANQLKSQYPNLEFISIDSVETGLEKIITNELFAVAAPITIVSHRIQKEYDQILRISGLASTEFGWSMAVHQSQPELFEILNRFIASLTPENHQLILNKWISVSYAQPVNYKTLITYGIFIVLILSVLIYRQRLLARYNRDLTALVELKTADLTRAKEQAEQANRSKTEFLANISHELRTPMHAILSFSSMGLKRADNVPTEKLVHYFSRIDESGRRLLFLLNDLLDLSKLEAGRMDFSFKKSNLLAIAQIAVDELQELGNSKAITMKLIPPDFDVIANIDDEKILLVIRNLLSNALKFTPEGKTVELSFSETTLFIEDRNVDSIAILVSDEGPGIPENENKQIFEKFVQSSKTRSGAGGTGLGLAICKQIIDGHNGTIEASNNNKGGAVFCFTVPRKKTN